MARLRSCWSSLILVLGSLTFSSLGEVVVAEDVDLGGAVFAEFEDLFDPVALQGLEDHLAHLGVHLGAVGGFAFGELGDDGAHGEVEVDVVALVWVKASLPLQMS